MDTKRAVEKFEKRMKLATKRTPEQKMWFNRERTLVILKYLILKDYSKPLSTLDEKRACAERIQSLLDNINGRLVCPQCKREGRLRVTNTLKNMDGVFQIIHTKGQKTNHQIGPQLLQSDPCLQMYLAGACPFPNRTFHNLEIPHIS